MRFAPLEVGLARGEPNRFNQVPIRTRTGRETAATRFESRVYPSAILEPMIKAVKMSGQVRVHRESHWKDLGRLAA
jgi:uncharacterized protein YqfA (UPF0365 family)